MKAKNNHYVYVYFYPDTHVPFYVGKGQGNRALAQLGIKEKECETQKIIDDIRQKGHKPIIEIIQWGLSKDAALAAEAALIQFVGLAHLTNKQAGHGTHKLHADFIEYIRDKTPLRVSQRKGEKMLVISANPCYRDGMSRYELYDAVRCNLDVAKERVEACRHVLVVLGKKVLDVYVNPSCVEAGKLPCCYETREPPSGFDIQACFADDRERNRYVGRSLAVSFGFNHFAYAKICVPKKRG